jgi:predicted ATPase
VVSLIGRDHELARLAELLDDTAGGRCGVAVLSGVPGIGKSRIARELLALARSRGFLALSGIACPYQGGLSYAPVVEALRPLVAVDDPARARLVEGLTVLGRLFSGLPLPAATSLGDPSLERTRLFEAVSRLVQRVVATRPVLLMVDDVHWADPNSLDLLLYLTRSMAGFPCVIALAYRTGEAGQGLRTVLATVRRTEGLVELPVRPLDSGGVAALARSLLGSAPPSPLLDLLGAQAQGIPLFVQALISSLTDAGQLFRSGGTWVLGPGAGQIVPPTSPS